MRHAPPAPPPCAVKRKTTLAVPPANAESGRLSRMTSDAAQPFVGATIVASRLQVMVFVTTPTSTVNGAAASPSFVAKKRIDGVAAETHCVGVVAVLRSGRLSDLLSPVAWT